MAKPRCQFAIFSRTTTSFGRPVVSGGSQRGHCDQWRLVRLISFLAGENRRWWNAQLELQVQRLVASA